MGKKRTAPEVSESERLLFGGPLRYDMGWNQHADAFLELNFRAMITRLPSLLASSLRLARQADRGAARIVLITHRLASVRHADLVHVLDQGRLVESGTPDELLATGGLYAELYALQAEQFAPSPAPVRKVPAPKAG